jgi:N utilization substance protein B
MLSRRQLRVKVLQALYAYFQSGNQDILQGERQLLLSINKLHELFIYQLSFLIETTRFAEQRLEENRKKHFPTEDDLNPSLNFIQNKVLAAIDNNSDYRKKEDLYKINWSKDQDLVRRFYQLMRETPEYEQYIKIEKTTFNQDKKFVGFLIEKLFTKFELLQFFYEEKSIYFVDDFHLVSELMLRYVKFLDEKADKFNLLPSIYRTENDEVNEDLVFVKDLFRKTISHSEEYGKLIAGYTSNWEQDRIAVMDMLILKMALTELVEFSAIPVKVSMNEYIEISKFFSTNRSSIFVNGILDRMIHDFKEDGRILKRGRGLLDE